MVAPLPLWFLFCASNFLQMQLRRRELREWGLRQFSLRLGSLFVPLFFSFADGVFVVVCLGFVVILWGFLGIFGWHVPSCFFSSLAS